MVCNVFLSPLQVFLAVCGSGPCPSHLCDLLTRPELHVFKPAAVNLLVITQPNPMSG